MAQELSFGAAFIVGLLGSTHCLGMCGGIVAALNMGIAGDLSSRPPAAWVPDSHGLASARLRASCSRLHS
jgi:sulfite exporter TauE/SafE